MSNNTIYLISALFLTSMQVIAQDFDSFLDHVNGLASDAEKQLAVDSFKNVVDEFPYIEQNTAYFIYCGDAISVKAAGDFNGWTSATAYVLTSLPGTDMWYVGADFESNARLDYKLIRNETNWILDPLNPNTVNGGFGPNSELAMPEYIQPWEIVPNPSIEKGIIENVSIYSTIVGREYDLRIYLPRNYDANRDPGYAVAYFQDGFETATLGSGIDVLDNLIHATLMDEVIGVFVRPNDRAAEYSFADRFNYRDFFVDELVRYIDEQYNTVRYANHRAVIGASFGGNISGLIAFTHPEVFGNCGIHSGALYPNGNEVYDLIVNSPELDIKVANIWGSYEGLSTLMTSLTNYLEQNNYDYIASELPEGHSWGLWRATLDDMLEFFFGYLTTTIEEFDQPLDLELYYDSAAIAVHYQFELQTETQFDIQLFDMEGDAVHHKRYTGFGNIEGKLGAEQLPNGVYSFVLEFEGGRLSRQLSIVR